MTMVNICIYYSAVLWVLYEAWKTSDREGRSHIPNHFFQVHLGHAQLLYCLLEPRDWTKHLISGVVVQWQIFIYVYDIPLFFSVIWGMDNVWQRRATINIISRTPTTPQTCLAFVLLFVIKRLNHSPHQWYSGPRIIIHVWIFYLIVLWVLNEAWATSDGNE